MANAADKLVRELGFRLGTVHRDYEVEGDRRYRFSDDQAFSLAYTAGRLDDESRSVLQIMRACGNPLPLCFLPGSRRPLRDVLEQQGLVTGEGRLTDLGRTVAEVLLELA